MSLVEHRSRVAKAEGVVGGVGFSEFFPKR